jgi:DNA-binding NtrC family response regulator
MVGWAGEVVVASVARPRTPLRLCTRPAWRTDEPTDDHGLPVGRTLAEVERDLILVTLRHCLGNRTHAANILGISLRTLRNKLNEYASQGVPVPPPGMAEVRSAQ